MLNCVIMISKPLNSSPPHGRRELNYIQACSKKPATELVAKESQFYSVKTFLSPSQVFPLEFFLIVLDLFPDGFTFFYVSFYFHSVCLFFCTVPRKAFFNLKSPF